MGIDAKTSCDSVLDEISLYESRVTAGRCGQQICARCGEEPRFRRHELRYRQLRVIVNSTVLVRQLLIARWRCPACRYVFTDYPSFRPSVQALRQPKSCSVSSAVSR